LRLSKIFLPILTHCTIDEKSSSRITIHEASLATSVHLSPIAIHISAALSAGASFTPSQVIATKSPFFLSKLTIVSFSSGTTLAIIFVVLSLANNWFSSSVLSSCQVIT
jgi:hypothetical protein